MHLICFFSTFSAFNFGSQGFTRIAALAPEFKKASDKISSVFATLDRKTKLDASEGDYPTEPLSGSIVFKNVYFRYPTRKQIRVLRVGFLLIFFFFHNLISNVVNRRPWESMLKIFHKFELREEIGMGIKIVLTDYSACPVYFISGRCAHRKIFNHNFL